MSPDLKHIAQDLALMATMRKQVADALDALYPAGAAVLVNIRHGQKTPSEATVMAACRYDREGNIRVRLKPTRRSPYGLVRDVPYTDVALAATPPPQDAAHGPDPACTICKGSGEYCVGTSGREEDGNCPITERCDCAACAPSASTEDSRVLYGDEPIDDQSFTPLAQDAAHGPMTSAPEVGTKYWDVDSLALGYFRWEGTDTELRALGQGLLFRSKADARAALQAGKGGNDA